MPGSNATNENQMAQRMSQTCESRNSARCDVNVSSPSNVYHDENVLSPHPPLSMLLGLWPGRERLAPRTLAPHYDFVVCRMLSWCFTLSVTKLKRGVTVLRYYATKYIKKLKYLQIVRYNKINACLRGLYFVRLVWSTHFLLQHFSKNMHTILKFSHPQV